MKQFYGRFKINNEWLDWHKIDGLHNNIQEAKERFMQNTKFLNSEVEVTEKEPLKYYGSKTN